MQIVLGGLGALTGACAGNRLRPYVHRFVGQRPPAGPTSLGPARRCRTHAPSIKGLSIRGLSIKGLSARLAQRPGTLEVVTAFAVGALVATRGAGWQTLGCAIWTIVGCALATVDIVAFRLPNALTLPLYPVLIGLAAVAAIVHHDATPLVRALLGMLTSLAWFAALIALRPGQLGRGDLKLAGSLGLALGWVGWHTLLVGALAAFSLAALPALPALAGGHRLRDTPLPFGPFMVLGAWSAVLIAPA